MARALRYDTHRLDGVETLPSGALRVPARVARVGVLDYDDGAGNTWGELVPPDTLFDPASMASLRGVALTDLHPGAPVTPESRRALQRGHVGDLVAQDGAYLSAPVYVTDAEAIARVQSGERKDVSCGYSCELDETPGEYEGKPYARVQRDRVYNHLGIGPEGWGRAGTEVGLRLDGAGAVAGEPAGARVPVARLDSGTAPADTQGAREGAQKTSTSTDTTGRAAATTRPTAATQRSAMAQQQTNTRTTRRDGDEPPPKPEDKESKKPETDGGDEMVPKKDADAMVAEQVAKIAALDALVNALSKQLAELKATMASEESAEVTEADVPEAVADSIVAKRLAKLVSATTDAKLVAPTVKLDGLVSTRKVHEAALSLVVPEMKFDGLTDDRVAGMFDALAATAKKAAEKGAEKGEKRQDGKSVRNDALGAAHRAAAGEPGERPADTVEDAIRKMHQDSCDDWKRATPALRVPTTIKAD